MHPGPVRNPPPRVTNAWNPKKRGLDESCQMRSLRPDNCELAGMGPGVF